MALSRRATPVLRGEKYPFCLYQMLLHTEMSMRLPPNSLALSLSPLPSSLLSSYFVLPPTLDKQNRMYRKPGRPREMHDFFRSSFIAI